MQIMNKMGIINKMQNTIMHLKGISYMKSLIGLIKCSFYKVTFIRMELSYFVSFYVTKMKLRL